MRDVRATVPSLSLTPWLVLGSEWAVNQHRDSLALYVGFDSLAQFIAVAENESIGRVKFNSLQVTTRSGLSTHDLLLTACVFCASAENDTTLWAASSKRRRLTAAWDVVCRRLETLSSMYSLRSALCLP